MKDPTGPADATSPNFSRSAFLGLGAGAAALGASGSGAFAAGEFGKPHPPFVSESDPDLAIARPQLSHGERTLDAYAARPKDGEKIGGAIVVVQAIWGVDAQLRDTVRRLAKAGYAAIAPDLYAGLGAQSGDGATDIAPFRPLAAGLVEGTVAMDLAAAAAWALHDADPDQARKPGLRAGITGFCMGGGIALRQTIAQTAAFAAAAIWYGDVTKISASAVKVPLLGGFGARDTSIPADAVREFASKLDVPYDVRIYSEAGHAFFDDTRSSYVPTSATEGWDRTLAWFATYLRPK